MRKKHSKYSSPLLIKDPLSRTHLLNSESSKIQRKAIGVNEKLADGSDVKRVERNDYPEPYEEGDDDYKVSDNGQKNEENESTDQKRKRGRPKKNLVSSVNRNSLAEVSEKRGRGRPKGSAKAKYEAYESDDEDVEKSTTRGTPNRAAAKRKAIVNVSHGSESDSESDSDSRLSKKKRGRPKKNSPAKTIKRKSRGRPKRIVMPKSTYKAGEESEISTDSNSQSSASELERELQRESEEDSESDTEIETEIESQSKPKANPGAVTAGTSKRGRGRPKVQKNTEYLVSEGEEEDFEVEKILGEKIEGGRHYFLVKWKNWSENSNSWEIADNVTCDELIESFRNLCRSMHPNKRTAESNLTETPIGKKSKTNEESDGKESHPLSDGEDEAGAQPLPNGEEEAGAQPLSNGEHEEAAHSLADGEREEEERLLLSDSEREDEA